MKKVILALSICATIVSCQRQQENVVPIDVSKTVYLMNDAWQLKASTWKADITDTINGPVDQYTSLPSCQKDNYWIFNSPSVVTMYEGKTKCNINAPDSTVYGYTLTNNDNYLTIYNGPVGSPNNTVYLEGNMAYPSIDTFVLTYQAPDPLDTSKTSQYVQTYVKQP